VAEPERRAGSLTIVGAGIRPGLHTTREAIARIRDADKVLYLLAELAPIRWLEELNPSAESLEHAYRPGRPYAEVYQEVVETILDHVRRSLDVCVVFYGHPGVYDRTSYEAMAQARSEGFPARILPGITADDCLYVDLELDPGKTGCQSYDATDFLVRRRRPEVTVPLILWQVGVVGGSRTTGEVRRSGLEVLAERLEELYGPEHEAIVYEATPFPIGRPFIEPCEIRHLVDAGITGLSTLYVPPKGSAKRDPDLMARLGMASASEREG
jgi:Tetrapyrrole (Corrin/Porphyrin) Methylases